MRVLSSTTCMHLVCHICLLTIQCVRVICLVPGALRTDMHTRFMWMMVDADVAEGCACWAAPPAGNVLMRTQSPVASQAWIFAFGLQAGHRLPALASRAFPMVN